MSTIAYISEILAALFATFYFSKYKDKPIRMILVILWLTVVSETAARVSIWLGYRNNHGIYNIYALLFYSLFFRMIYRHINDKLRKKIAAILSISMIATIVIAAIITPFLTLYMSHVYSVATMITVLLLMYYAIDLLKSNQHFSLKNNRLELSVFAGFLLFMISFIPLSPILFGIWLKNLTSEASTILWTIQLTTVIFMNLLIIFGLIWSQKTEH